MKRLPASDLGADFLRSDERFVDCVSAGGVFASNHNLFPTNAYVLLTNRRLCMISPRGLRRKRFGVDAAWDYAEFSQRVNSSAGTALGPFLHTITLFSKDDEMVVAGFRDPGDAEEYKHLVAEAIGRATG